MSSKTKGYLLIEAMVAMGVLTTSVLGIFALMSQSIKLTRVIDDQYVGTYLAAEGIEIVKNLLDANAVPLSAGPWNPLPFSSGGCYEIDIETTNLAMASSCVNPGTPLRLGGSLYSYAGGGVITGFSRSVTIIPIMDATATMQEGVRVVSTVTWAGGGSSVMLEDKFYNWHL